MSSVRLPTPLSCHVYPQNLQIELDRPSSAPRVACTSTCQQSHVSRVDVSRSASSSSVSVSEVSVTTVVSTSWMWFTLLSSAAASASLSVSAPARTAVISIASSSDSLAAPRPGCSLYFRSESLMSVGSLKQELSRYSACSVVEYLL